KTATETQEVECEPDDPHALPGKTSKMVLVKARRMNVFATNELHVLSGKLRDILVDLPDWSYLTKQSLINAGITSEMCRQAAVYGKKEDREKAKAIFFNERKAVTADLLWLPTLYLDATVPETIVARFLRGFRVVADVEAQTPNMAVHQVIGPFGKTDLVADSK